MSGWRDTEIPDLHGRRAIVTGGSFGLGVEIARALAAKGAFVTLTSRDPARAQASIAALRATEPDARLAAGTLDLADLASVAAFAATMAAEGPLDLLINNAGVMTPARRELTADGFERQFGTNHLGPFALTLLLLPALRRAPAPARIVTVASIAHRRAVIAFDDLQSARHYVPRAAYAQSKLANLMFALELDRRLRANGDTIRSVAAHPGLAYTNIVSTPLTGRGALLRAVVRGGFQLIAQSAARGTLPILQAATDPAISGGSYLGPNRWGETRGDPAPAVISPQAANQTDAALLWNRSEQLTGQRFP